MDPIHLSPNSANEGPTSYRRLTSRAFDASRASPLPVLRFIPHLPQDCCAACPASIEDSAAAKITMPRGGFCYLCPACLACDDATLRERLVRKIGEWRACEDAERARRGTADPTYAAIAADLNVLAAGFAIHRDGLGPWLDQIDVCANPSVRAAVEAAVLGSACKPV